MSNIRKAVMLVSIAFALFISQSPAYAVPDGFGSASDTMPFYVTDDTGAVSVGTWTAAALNVTGGFTVTGNAVVMGNVTALYYAHTSDVRLKSEIHPVNDALDKLLSIQGVEFTWKENGRRDMGVIAQNVEQVFPDVVHTDQWGVKSVEYDSLVAPIIESIRKLKAENDKLSADIKDIRAQLDAVRGEQ